MSYCKPTILPRITEKEITNKVAGKVGVDPDTVEEVSQAIFNEITDALEKCHPVNVKNFGTFFIRSTSPTRTFKFSPSQKLRSILGWSSTYSSKK
jgi:hypothetical protein